MTMIFQTGIWTKRNRESEDEGQRLGDAANLEHVASRVQGRGV